MKEDTATSATMNNEHEKNISIPAETDLAVASLVVSSHEDTIPDGG